jgi:hypothetical protein
MYLQKGISIKTVEKNNKKIVGILKVTDEKSRIRICIRIL